MSHIGKAKLVDEEGLALDSNDLDAWELAAALMGGELVRDQKTYNCYPAGWQGDTAPPEGWDPSLWTRCDHAIRFPGLSYEVGLLRQDGTLNCYYDYYSYELSGKLGGKEATKLVEAYRKAKRTLDAAATIRQQARIYGGSASREVLPSRLIKLTVNLP